MRVVVLGAGAMGSIFGAAFARSGADVAFFDRRPEVIDAIRLDGVILSGVLGARTLKAEASTDPSKLGSADIALVLVDSTATADVAPIAEACLRPDGFALTLQNGIGNWEVLSERLGTRRVLAGSTYNSGAGQGPGRAAHTNIGPSVIGEIDGSASARARIIAQLLTLQGLPCEALENIKGHIWSKFVHNCAINPVSAITGLRPGEIARTPAAAHLLDRVLEEVLMVVEAQGIRLPEHDPRRHIRDHCWERYNRPSMLQHLQRGRRTEIDTLNGALVERARRLGISVPFNEAIVLAVRALEAAQGRSEEDLNEEALERAASAQPRGESWG